MIDSLIGGAAGMLLGALLIGARDDCVDALRALMIVPPGLRTPLAGVVTGPGIARLVAGAWVLHGAPG
jgi:hypothetical protein